MSSQTDHTIVRLRVPPELKDKIEQAAEQNNRSQSAEMVSRLEESFLANNVIQQQETRIELLTTLLKENHEMMADLNKRLESIFNKKNLEQ